MNLKNYIRKNAKNLTDEIVLEEVGTGKVLIGLDAITLEHYIDGFIRNKLKEGDIHLLPTYEEEGLEEMAKEAEKLGIYPYPKEIGVGLEFVDEFDEELYTFMHIRLEPFYTVGALKHFGTLPPINHADEDVLLTVIYGGGGESTDIILDILTGVEDISSGEDEDCGVMARLLSITFEDTVESQGFYYSEDEEGQNTLALFSLTEDFYKQ